MLPAAAAAAKSLQSYPTLCDPIEGSPPGSPVPGILLVDTISHVSGKRLTTTTQLHSFYMLAK